MSHIKIFFKDQTSSDKCPENYFIYGITNGTPGSHADRWIMEEDNKMTFFAKKGTCKLSEISILFIEESSK